MRIETKPWTRRAPNPFRRHDQTTRQRQRDAHARTDQIVRVQIKWRLYAYVCRGPVRIGDRVVIDTPFSGTLTRRVMLMGPGDWSGPFKRARRVR